MDRREIESIVIEVLEAVQETSGEAYIEVGPDDRPIGVLDGFDSLTGLEATAMVEKRIGCEIERASAFVSKDGRRALTLAETCEYLEGIVVSGSRAVA